VTPKLKTLLATVACVVPLDQVTKAWVAANVEPGSLATSIPVIDGFFYVTHARNPGAAFGLLVDWPAAWRLAVFVGVAAVAIAVIVSFYRSLAPGERFNALALGLILGGSIGNLTDRVLRGEVIDFLHFRLWGSFAWPDFNVADTCIVLGVGGLVIELLATEGASRAARHDGDVESPSRADDAS
jgi:signal peptidase II